MQQIVFIHGGNTFETHEEYIAYLKAKEVNLDYLRQKRWKDAVIAELGPDFDVIQLVMPNRSNAQYEEWKLWFEKYIPLLDDNLILIGTSLGGIFLAKYLSENDFPKNIEGLFLVAAPYGGTSAEGSLASFSFDHPVNNLEHKAKRIFLYHSRDDQVVPFSDLAKYKSDLPSADTREFEDRGHFIQDTFPEILEDIKSI